MLVVAAIVIGAALGLAIDIARDGGLAAWLTPGLHENPGPTYAARGVSVAVDGRAVYLDCRGAGSPTVILEAGFGGGADGWGTLLDGLAAITRTCAWDRPGLGRSTPRGLHTGAEAVADLRSALAAAGERGPYVVVAHSLGGIYARLFAASAGDPVLGLVMLDTYEPDLGMDADPALDQAFRDEIRRSLDDAVGTFRRGEDLDLTATLPELQAADAALPRTLLLYTDPYGRYQEPDQEAKVAAWYRAIRRRYPHAELEIVPGVSHFIHLDRPDLVIDRVRQMLLALESGATTEPSGAATPGSSP
ncbi:MAG TPA: alpha/beta hydrolase [Patescibacteria group bacterium]|nr:alpha/beta hydrolase [Patescibacteria group bacterium]